VRKLQERLLFLGGFAAGGVYFLLCSALGIVWLLVSPRNRQTLYYFGRVFCRGLVRMMRWRIAVENRERLEELRPCVFVANHQSFLDVVTFGSIFPPKTVSAGKREIGRIPVFGAFYRLSGNLVIDRGRPRDAHASLEEAGKVLREEGVSVWFMPEGHRNTGKELLPFKSGAFRLARAAGVPLVPIVAEPLVVIVDTRARRARAGTLRVRVLEPVAPEELQSRDLASIATETRERMQRELDRLRADGSL
jgi:1-acyl-sn-glycerol-3-phosphate acyltransferase